MGLFKLFERSSFEQAWSYTTNGVIWRLLSSGGDIIIGEDRNLDAKKVSFFGLDAKTGNALWEHLTFDEQWWISIEQAHNGVVFFHEFATPDLPEHKKIHALDINTGKKLWENSDVQYNFTSGDFVYASKAGFEQRKYFELELKTGSVVREVPVEEIASLQSNRVENNDGLYFPTIYSPENSSGEMLPRSVMTELQTSIQSEYIIHPLGDVIVTVYKPEQQKIIGEQTFFQELFILGTNGKKVFRETLTTGIRYPIPNTFLCKGDMLYYIKEKNILCAVSLRKS